MWLLFASCRAMVLPGTVPVSRSPQCATGKRAGRPAARAVVTLPAIVMTSGPRSGSRCPRHRWQNHRDASGSGQARLREAAVAHRSCEEPPNIYPYLIPGAAAASFRTTPPETAMWCAESTILPSPRSFRSAAACRRNCPEIGTLNESAGNDSVSYPRPAMGRQRQLADESASNRHDFLAPTRRAMSAATGAVAPGIPAGGSGAWMLPLPLVRCAGMSSHEAAGPRGDLAARIRMLGPQARMPRLRYGRGVYWEIRTER